ncbi:MAG: GTP-binding protein TypA [Alphaproteobacteria bacterium 16-39-46]|nr:MAG: GTP-binding protein TypA [Alphaproteobacteria bacterium 16-39-46]OZA40992.1 MAG: GTP-binding protein TypA [Alphaproteobacteria bacterium 17-39-52]HQS84426.1 translational GTPase TypA [Alphaproteobacteria bacterium]HQS94733.1 translational GTPase TypA [Alphaproteobacteria bacterium]
MTEIRNIAIIAHVDHGKTTLIDALLKQSGTYRDNQVITERVMDSNDLEKERGITILAKCTSMTFHGVKYNIVDTPGHADFGGEVERVLSMVDGVALLVDASEGPLPQTKFVLSKALALGLHPIVIINKVDRSDARIDEVHEEIFDLFMGLGATDKQQDFPMLYASGRSGWAVLNLEKDAPVDLTPFFDLVKSHVPAPNVDKNGPFTMLATLLDSDLYLGRVLIGKIYSGTARLNIPVKSIDFEGSIKEQGRLTKLFTFSGIDRVAIEEAEAGDIIAVAGLTNTSVSDTICALDVTIPLPSTPIDPPTMAITISVNDSPFGGTEGTKVTSRMIRDRLLKEAESNVAITVTETDDKDAFEVGGRGELQLGVLIETMRREGFEVSVSRPRVLMKKDENGTLLEPFEEVLLDVDEEFSGVVVEKLSLRKGEMTDMRPSGGGKVRLTFVIPARGLIGYQSEFRNATRGTGVLSRLFHGFFPFKGDIPGRTRGVLISNAQGEAVTYALWNLEERGTLFVTGGTKVYEGMIIGENARENDLEVNALKSKQLTNFRAAGKDEAMRLTPPRIMTLEEVISYIEDDELVEVTPKNIRLRKKLLDPNDRKRADRSKK